MSREDRIARLTWNFSRTEWRVPGLLMTSGAANDGRALAVALIRAAPAAFVDGLHAALNEYNQGSVAPLLDAARLHGLTAADVAASMNLSRQRIYQLANEGPEGRDRVRCAVLALLQERGVDTSAPPPPPTLVDKWIDSLVHGRGKA